MCQEREVADHCIMLRSGKLFDITNPEASEFSLEDIAHGLAHTCRYAGQCDGFYSVAEHSVLVSKTVSAFKLAALFHDAAEAFIGDMAGPLKRLLPEYRAIEKRIERAIFKRFCIEWPAPPAVKAADLSVLMTEQKFLMPPGTNSWIYCTTVAAANVPIHKLSPANAKMLFLERYAELTQGNAAGYLTGGGADARINAQSSFNAVR